MRKYALALILLICATATFAQNGIEQVTADVEFLADDALEGRATGTAGEAIAAGYIAGRFEQLGLEPMGENNFYFQGFGRKPSYNPHAAVQADTSVMIIGKNVIAFMDNGAATTVVIGGHYDHLGWGDEGSLHKGESAIHNGADDNASGIAAMLWLAERVKDHKGHNYLFMAFSGEERGLWGSNYFCDNPTLDLSTVAYMINMDMVGRLNEENTLAINGVGTSPEWPERLEKIDVDDIAIVTSESGVGPSDHTSFYLEDIPVLHFFTGQHEDYHKPSDDAELVNFEGIVSVAKFILALVADMDGIEKPEFTKTKEETSDTPRFTVTLGVVPDYLFDGHGMRIDGVTEGKPAANAGMVKGDIVIKMGELEVADMMGYMEALSQFEKGDSTIVVVNRDGEEIELEVEF